MYYKFVYAESYKKSQVKHAEPVAYVRADNYKSAKAMFYSWKRSNGIGIKSSKTNYLKDKAIYRTTYLIN